MTLGLEFLGVFLAGVGFSLVMLAILIPRLGPRLIRWQMRKTMTKAVIAVAAANVVEEPSPFTASPQTIERFREP